MEVGLKKESPITYSNGKRLFTIDQKVDALVRIKMTGCSKAEVARSLHVAESTFRGWFKNKDIVMKAEAKYNEMKTKSSNASSDGYKSDDNSKSFSVDGSDNNSSTCYTEDREGSRSRFSSPDPCAPNAPVRRSPERPHLLHHNKQKLKKPHHNNSLSLGNSNGLLNGTLNASLNAGLNASLNAGLNASLNAGFNASLNASLTASLGGGLGSGLNGGLNGSLGGGLGHLTQQQQLQHHLSQLAHHPLHHNISSLTGLKGSNAAAAAAVAAAAAAAAVAADHPSLRLSPAELQSKINNYFSPSPLLATSLPGSVNFLSPNFTTESTTYNKSSSFINTMVTATLMEPQALDLSTHSRNKCKGSKRSLTTTTVTNTTTTQTSPKILRHNSYRNLYKPYSRY
ncbi:FK506-binding protein 5-like isoform X2 [Sipha flava]|uniref:FK506-binding protein 5-like isoform X2 n=1 Tax=Sipha flava TaxID=143950 RepID=A0A8B8FKZ2_9HEMI|nr:FK506-binding protein 5-like isoform X2 [Sipha flava]